VVSSLSTLKVELPVPPARLSRYSLQLGRLLCGAADAGVPSIVPVPTGAALGVSPLTSGRINSGMFVSDGSAHPLCVLDSSKFSSGRSCSAMSSP
jgi:hypothetical protein